MTDMPSITALSEGPAVMLGAIPERGGISPTHTCAETNAHTQAKPGETDVIMRDITASSLIKQTAAESLIDLTKGVAVRSHFQGQR